MDAHTAVLVGTLVVVLGALVSVLWRAVRGPALRHVDLDAPGGAHAVRAPRRAVPLPPEVRSHVERLVAAGRPARAINLILKRTDLEIEDAHDAVDAVAAKVAKPGQHAWQAAQAADKEAARLAKETGDVSDDGPGGAAGAAVSAGLVGLDRSAQVEIERMLQGGRMDEAVETVKEATGMTTGQARASIEIIRAQLQRRNAGARTGQRVQQRATTPKPQTRTAGRGTAPRSGGGRKR